MNLRHTRLLAAAITTALLMGACSGGGDDGQVEAGGEAVTLSGLLRLAPGQCADAGVTTGSYFRMVTPDEGATVTDGPFVENGDSPCGDITFTPLAPGSDGGLRLGAYQPNPDPVFDDAGGSLAGAIVSPTPFFAVAFGIGTNETDPQTQTATAAPAVRSAEDGTLTGDLSSVAASWNGQHFNQGSPKPDGSTPGLTTAVSGTYDEATGSVVLEWTSLIEGGPFDQFTGVWHLEGTLEAA